MMDMPSTGITMINLAFRVRDLADAEAFVNSTEGWRKTATHMLDGEAFLEAEFGGVRVNFFRSAIYDADAGPHPSGFLHASYAVPDLTALLANPAWAKSLMWGPEEISGGFGRRRIAFFEPLPGCRIELMEEL